MKKQLCTISMMFMLSQAHALDHDVHDSKDHEIFSRYPGSIISNYDYRDYEAFTLPLGPISGKRKNYQADSSLELEGRLTRLTYRINEKTSTLKVYRNYTSALKSSGFSELYKCSGKDCGDRNSWPHALGQLSLSNGKQESIRYIAAKRVKGENSIYAAVFVMERANHQVVAGLIVLETKEMESGLVEINLQNLQQQLADNGKVAIYGIHFDTGKAELKQESTVIMETIKQLLESDKNLNLYIVGHTDDTGNLSQNLDLSRRRAEAVVTALVSNYKISSERLTAFGAGPYAPVASNDSEAGRKQNRRVELVKRLNQP